MNLAILIAAAHAVTGVLAQPGFYADGGYTATKTPCFEGWVFKDKKGNNNFDLITPSATCVSFDELQPNMDAGPLLDATDPNTDTLKWCSTRETYNPTAANEENTKEWGYCLEDTNVEITSSPTADDDDGQQTVSPTASESSSSPTTSDDDGQGEQTSSPTASEATSSPTANGGDDAGNEYFADGGFMDEPTPCYPNWEWKEKKGTNDFELLDPSGTCIPFSEFNPANDESLGELKPPTDDKTDQLMWCSTIDIYNAKSQNEDNLRSWGYCLTRSIQGTDSPTQSQATTAPTPLETSSPTDSETTSSPSISEATSSPSPNDSESTPGPSVTPETSSPTAPTTSGGGNLVQPGSDDVNAAAIAVPVVLIIVIAAIVVAAVLYKQKRDNEEALPTTKGDDDGAVGPQDTSDKRTYSPMKFFNQAASKSASSLRNLTQSFTASNQQAEPMSEHLVEPLQTEEQTKVEVEGGVAQSQPEQAATNPSPDQTQTEAAPTTEPAQTKSTATSTDATSS